MAFKDSATGMTFDSVDSWTQWKAANPGAYTGLLTEVPGDVSTGVVRVGPGGTMTPGVPVANLPNAGAAEEPVPDFSKYSEGFDLMKKLATGVGPTEQGKYSLQQNLLNRQNTIDASTRQGAGAMAQARSSLAARGGVGFGARERLAQTGADNTMMAKQGAYRDANSNMLEILKGDQGRKDQALQGFTGMQMDRYKMDLDRWGANRQAQALEKSAGQSGGGK
jgi:hypothetical protein